MQVCICVLYLGVLSFPVSGEPNLAQEETSWTVPSARAIENRGDKDTDSRPRRRASIAISSGSTYAGIDNQLYTQMRSLGFGDTSGSGWWALDHPREFAGDAFFAFMARFVIREAMSGAFGFSNKNLGGAIGYDDVADAYLESEWRLKTVWVGAFWHPAPNIRIGGGPGLYRLSSKGPSLNPQLHSYTSRAETLTRLGVFFGIGLELPANRLFFLDLSAKYHVIPGGDIEHGDGNTKLMLDPTWSHGEMSVGVGMRI